MKYANILLISHFAENKGTTDYLVDYLKQRNLTFYYLRHPLPETDYRFSELIFYDGNENQTLKKYSRPNSFLLKTIKEIMINLLTGLRLKRRNNVTCVIAFGAINATLPALAKTYIGKIVFFGVDYSITRFENKVLNQIYKYCETIACKHSTYVLSHTKMQEAQRFENHGLDPEKSVISPTGVNLVKRLTAKSNVADFAYVYIGSLSRHHGVFDFIRLMHLADVRNKLYVFGNGSEYSSILSYIQDNQLDHQFLLQGVKSPGEIESFIVNQQYRFIGVAPYKKSGHAIFGDSIKIKEYVNLGMPFISSDAVMIDEPLKTYGKIYANEEMLKKYLVTESEYKFPELSNIENIMHDYRWDSIFNKSVLPLVQLER